MIQCIFHEVQRSSSFGICMGVENLRTTCIITIMYTMQYMIKLSWRSCYYFILLMWMLCNNYLQNSCVHNSRVCNILIHGDWCLYNISGYIFIVTICFFSHFHSLWIFLGTISVWLHDMQVSFVIHVNMTIHSYVAWQKCTIPSLPNAFLFSLLGNLQSAMHKLG